MKKTISYEKDIIFKTNIGEICSISLEHDFTVDNGFLKGDFILEGEYKPNELSLNKEPFNYRLPLEYELDSNVDLDTLSYEIENFEYNVKDDELNVYIEFGVRYEEKKVDEPIIPEVTEDDLNQEIFKEDFFDMPITPEERTSEVEEPHVVEEIKETEVTLDDEAPRLNEEEKSVVIDSMSTNEEEYITYHVHIVREGDNLESIANKYKTTVEMIKEYNNVESLELKMKLIIPEVNE